MPGKEPSSEKAYRLIIDAIREQYKPGDFLLEKDLAGTFKMSRTPITMALHQLVTEGILAKMRKKGCYIPNLARKDAEAVFSTRKLVFELSSPRSEAKGYLVRNSPSED